MRLAYLRLQNACEKSEVNVGSDVIRRVSVRQDDFAGQSSSIREILKVLNDKNVAREVRSIDLFCEVRLTGV